MFTDANDLLALRCLSCRHAVWNHQLNGCSHCHMDERMVGGGEVCKLTGWEALHLVLTQRFAAHLDELQRELEKASHESYTAGLREQVVSMADVPWILDKFRNEKKEPT
jgi:hypothetical protein